MNAKAIMSLFLFAGLSVSASVENLDFGNRQQTVHPSYVSKVMVFVDRHVGGEFENGLGSYFEVTSTHEDDLDGCITRALRGFARTRVVTPGMYRTAFTCLGDQSVLINNRTVAEFEVDESLQVPEHAFEVDLTLPPGHFHAPGIERASIIVGEGDLAFPFVDTDFGSESLTLDTENGIVRFNDVIIPTVREYIEDGHFTAAHIRFDFADGSVRLYSLDGQLLNGQEEEPLAPSLRIDFSPDARTITITGAPNTSYIVEETPDLGTWQRWKEVTTNAEGFAQATDNRDDIATCFFRIK